MARKKSSALANIMDIVHQAGKLFNDLEKQLSDYQDEESTIREEAEKYREIKPFLNKMLTKTQETTGNQAETDNQETTGKKHTRQRKNDNKKDLEQSDKDLEQSDG